MVWKPAEIQEGLEIAVVGRVLHVFEEVGSTNDEAARLAEAGAPEGTAVLAERQFRGRGRLGRRWESPAGLGIWTSILFRPPLSPEEAPLFSLLGGVAASEAIGEVTGHLAGLKWPNDVMVAEKKAGGILAELQTEGRKVSHLVLGIGLNVNHTRDDFSEGLRNRATSLRMAEGKEVSRLQLLRVLYVKLDHWYDRLLREGPAPLLARYRTLCLTLGREVQVQGEGETFTGEAVDLSPRGELVVRLPTGDLRTVMAADVTLRGSSPEARRSGDVAGH